MTGNRRILSSSAIESLSEYRRDSGGRGLHAALHTSPESIIDRVTRAGLRGRGGAGFPTGKKWATIAASPPRPPRPVVINAAEGEPGTFKDRILLRRNPYLVLEGALIAALAVDADEIVVAAKSSFTHELERLRTAIAEIEAAGWTTGFDIRVVEGPSEYLFGEETALLEVIDGRPPFPRTMAPYRRGVHRVDASESGDAWRMWSDGPVALVDNVETLANVPGILAHGADWYRSVGTPSSPGTIICTVSGDTRRDGVDEFAMGTPLREVIEAVGGGTEPGRAIAAVLLGVSNPPLSGRQLDTRLSYEHMSAAGSGLGSASLIVIDDETSLRSVAAGVARFLSTESCGQCEPCKRDSLAVASDLASGGDDRARIHDRLGTVAQGARCALAGQVERVVGGLLDLDGSVVTKMSRSVRDEPYLIVPLVDLVGGHGILDLSYHDKRPDWTYAGEHPSSGVWPVHRLADHPVEITRRRSAEVDVEFDGDRTTSEPFEPLHRLHRQLEADLTDIRSARGCDVNARLIVLRADIERHRRAVERLIYPLVGRLVPDIGDDVTRYPERHEQHAARLLDRLDLEQHAIAPSLVDELCADVHTSIIELDRRVLPLLSRAVADDPEQLLLISAGITGEIRDV